jgi:hypothetical protein
MNMIFVYVITAEYFGNQRVSIDYLITAMNAKEIYIALGKLRSNYLISTFFVSMNTSFKRNIRW